MTGSIRGWMQHGTAQKNRKVEAIEDCSSPYVALVLVEAHRRSVRDILQICLPQGERDIYYIAAKRHSVCPSRDKIQLCTGPQQRECEQQVEGSGSAPVLSILHPALEFPGHNPEEGEGASEAKAHGMGNCSFPETMS